MKQPGIYRDKNNIFMKEWREITEPRKVDILYRQPYDRGGNWLDNKAIQGMLHQVPTAGEKLLECLDVQLIHEENKKNNYAWIA